MYRWTLSVLAFAFLGFGAVAQDDVPADLLSAAVTLDRDVYFFDSEGNSTLVPAGRYVVTGDDRDLQLFDLDTARNYELNADAGTHDQEVDAPTAMSVNGGDEFPDMHVIVLVYPDGSELSASGSYSGIQPRGLLDDARRKAEQAKRAAQQAALRAKQEAARKAEEAARRTQAIAEQARQRVQDGVEQARAKARMEMDQLLADIATAVGRGDRAEVARISALAAPKLAVLLPASMAPGQTKALIAEARRQLEVHRPFIDEVVRRIAANRNMFERPRDGFTPERLNEMARLIWGQGANQLRHPFAGPAVSTREASGDISTRGMEGIAFTIGVSYDVGLIAGVGAGGNIDVGFWGRMPQDLEDSGWGVDVGIALLADVGITLSFEPDADQVMRLSGFTLSPGGGAGVDVSVSRGVVRLIGCGNQLLL